MRHAERTHRTPSATDALPGDDRRTADTCFGQTIVQAKLTVGPANDPCEREADAIADRVVDALRSPSPLSPEMASPDGPRDEARVRRSSDVGGPGAGPDLTAGPRIRRTLRPATPITSTLGPRVERMQRSAAIGVDGGDLDGATEAAVRSSRGGGSALEPGVRRQMEGAFGADFSSVRVHEGTEAAELNDRIQAKAFTMGSDIYFRDGAPDTSSDGGRHLLAHELTHVVQQGGQRINRLMDAATYKAGTASTSGRRGGSKASKLDADLKTYAALKNSDTDLTQRKTLLDAMKLKTGAYRAAKPTGDRTAGVTSLEHQIDLELTFVGPAAESIAGRAGDPTTAARKALVAQDAYLAAVKQGHPIPPGQRDPDFDRLITNAMNAGNRAAVAAALVADDLATIKALVNAPGVDPLMKAILTEVLANEGDIAFGEGALSSGATVSSAKQKAATGKDYKVDLNVSSNPLGSAERISSLVHEMTHIAVQTRFTNTVIHLAFDAGDSDDTVVALSARRTKQLSDLDAALTSGSGDFAPGQVQLLRGKIAYPVTGKNTLQSYADTFYKRGDIAQPEYDRICGLVGRGANNTLIEFDTVINQMWFLVQAWNIPATNDFVEALETVAREAHTYRTA